MDFGKLRASGKGKKSEKGPAPSRPAEAKKTDIRGAKLSGPKKEPKNVFETKAWREGTGGIRQMWSNYVSILANDFRRRTRREQEVLIVRMCQVVTVGCAIVLTTFFYQFVPVALRVFGFPAFIVGAWFVATKVVGPIVIAQFESKLNSQ